MQIERDAAISKLTWFRLGGRAQFLFRPRDETQLSLALERASLEGVPVKVLGAGANVLISDEGFDGMVVRFDSLSFRKVVRNGDRVTAGAGVDLMPFSREMSYAGHTGLECMAGIPATIGGATRMNAGGQHGEFGDVVRTVRVMDQHGAIDERPRDAVGFSYRHTDLDGLIVTAVEMELPSGDPTRARRQYDDFMEQKTRSQPLANSSAGCIFKNPTGHSAGALIDRAGLKAASVGAASVSTRHANFIVADKGATASDVLALIDIVRERVQKEFQIELELEVDVWRPVRSGSSV